MFTSIVTRIKWCYNAYYKFLILDNEQAFSLTKKRNPIFRSREDVFFMLTNREKAHYFRAISKSSHYFRSIPKKAHIIFIRKPNSSHYFRLISKIITLFSRENQKIILF